MASKARRDVDKVVDRLAAERQLGQRLISLTEHSTSTVLTDLQQRVIVANEAALPRLDLRLEIHQFQGKYQTRLVAGDQIGTMRLVSGKEHIDIIVEPKIGNAAFLRMLEFSFQSLDLEDDAIAYETKASAPAFLIDFIVTQIERFLIQKRYRSYSLRLDPSSRHPKGHLDLHGYATRQMPKLHFDRMPCSYFDFSENVFENQVLASTLFIAGRLAASLGDDARRKITRHVVQARRFLPGVEIRRITEDQVNQFRYDRRNAMFRPVHDLCRILLFNASVSLSPSRLLSFMAFTLNMNQLFETYVRRLFQKLYGASVVPGKAKLRFMIRGTETPIILDGLIKNQPPTVVECKYKIVVDPSTLDFDEGRMKNADLYQCVAYATHEDVNAERVLLVYPSIAGATPVQVTKSIRSFLGRSGQAIPITVMLVNLAVPPGRVVEALPAALSSGYRPAL